MQEVEYIGAKTEGGKEHISANSQEFQKVLKESSCCDLINAEIWKYLTNVEAKMLRRWVGHFIEANRNKPEAHADDVAYPFMSNKLKRTIQRVSEIIRRKEIEQRVRAIKEHKKAGE